MVEQSAVNRSVVGSSPTFGANFKQAAIRLSFRSAANPSHPICLPVGILTRVKPGHVLADATTARRRWVSAVQPLREPAAGSPGNIPANVKAGEPATPGVPPETSLAPLISQIRTQGPPFLANRSLIDDGSLGEYFDLVDRITIDPNQCGGRPCIRGMRIRVKDVLDMLAEGATEQEILGDYPDLQSEDIRASLAYAARYFDHPVLVNS